MRRYVLLLTGMAIAAWSVAPAAQGPSFKVAFYNIRSGEGIIGLAGHPMVFAQSDNCDPAKGAVNAWGAGVVQKELMRAIGSDASVVALGLAEAWKCATPKSVRQLLGWKDDSGDSNGVALLARYGFSGRPEWQQLDTSQNKTPRDTMWVVHGKVCVDQRCSATIDIFSAHWSGTGPQAQQTFDRQAQQTVAFMMAKARGPHVLVGDLNVFEGSEVCRQQPDNTSLQFLRNAGYADAWAALHPNDPGYTGMLNRNGCGQPVGAPWKRIDYAWSKGLTPRSIERFGMVTPGDAAPSDHVGIIAGY